MLCFTSWNDASDGRLQRKPNKKKQITFSLLSANGNKSFVKLSVSGSAMTKPRLNLLATFQLIVAWITHAHIELKAHYRNIDAVAGAFVANGMATMTAMMLS